jgi:hypothetical protein
MLDLVPHARRSVLDPADAAAPGIRPVIVDEHEKDACRRREDGCRGEDGTVRLPLRERVGTHPEVLLQQGMCARVVGGEGVEQHHPSSVTVSAARPGLEP